MTKEQFKEEYTIRLYAHQYWNYDKIPPEDYRAKVVKYISDHPDEFGGVVVTVH